MYSVMGLLLRRECPLSKVRERGRRLVRKVNGFFCCSVVVCKAYSVRNLTLRRRMPRIRYKVGGLGWVCLFCCSSVVRSGMFGLIFKEGDVENVVEGPYAYECERVPLLPFDGNFDGAKGIHLVDLKVPCYISLSNRGRCCRRRSRGLIGLASPGRSQFSQRVLKKGMGLVMMMPTEKGRRRRTMCCDLPIGKEVGRPTYPR